MPVSMSAAVGRAVIVAGSALFATSHAYGQPPVSPTAPEPRLPAVVVAAGTPRSVGAAGFVLTTTAVELPGSDRSFPDGPGMDVTQQNCTACHSVGMVMNQPNLTAAAWDAEVNKMRVVYKAPIDAADIPVILNYLGTIKVTR